MIFIKDTLSFIFQVLLIIFVNLFVADITIPFILVVFAAFVTRYDTVSILGLDVKCVDIYIILLMVITILKYISLPILYNILYKISKNKIILGFINLLKINIFFKIFILFLTLIVTYLIHIFIGSNFSFSFILFDIIFFGLFGSYLFLFLWWEVEKWWKNDCDKWYGSKRIKNTKIYLEINKIFNKIQDFNYQNFRKCQKFILWLLIPVHKLLTKIKKVLDKKVF